MSSYQDRMDEAPDYIARVKAQSKLLIEQKVWDSISHQDLDDWLGNFDSLEENFLAALLLDNLVFRSSDQTNALLYHAIDTCLPSSIYETPWKIFEGENWLHILSQKIPVDERIRLVPVIRDDHPPTKSGPLVARLYRRHLGVDDRYMTWPWQVDDCYQKGTKIFVYIDDVLASGNQFLEFIQKTRKSVHNDCTYIYIPLLAHESGISNIQKNHPEIRIHPVEKINDSDNFFNQPNINVFQDIRDLYKEVSEKHLSKRFLSKMCWGYENLSLTVAYSHATPNASLPLYWYASDKFSPLIKR